MPTTNPTSKLSISLTKQQLYWLLASLSLILAIHAPNLPLWVTAVSVLFGAWRFAAIRRPILMPNRWLLVMLSLFTGFGILLNFHSFGRDASLSLLVLMTMLKLLETRKLRDYMLTIMLAYLVIFMAIKIVIAARIMATATH